MMNERIKELAEQSKCFTETYDNELLAAPEVLYCFYKEDFEKFAELIVRECAELVDRAISDGGVDGLVVKQHFGVEE